MSFKELKFLGVLKQDKWARHRQYFFNHIYSGREVKAKNIDLYLQKNNSRVTGMVCKMEFFSGGVKAN